MKKLFYASILMVFMLSIFLCCNITVNAKNFDGYEYGYRYSYINNQQVIKGVVINGYNGTSKDLIIPEEIEGYPVIEIGGFAFQNCTEITGVTIPETVTEIYDYAFAGCSSLSYINILSDKMSFGMDAFSGCNSLNKVYANSIETWINNFYFYEWNTSSNPLCNGADLYLNNTLATELVVTQNVSNIKPYAFYGCTSIESLSFDDSVTSITYCAFAGCIGLKEITIPETVLSIDYSAFYNCTGLTKINWNAKKVSDIEAGADPFYNCGSSNEGIAVVFGDGVECIPGLCFSNSKNVKTLSISNTVKTIGEEAFYGCSGITNVTIGNSVETIGRYSFSGCSSLTEITIPDSVTSIGYYAFSNCANLVSATIGDSIETISSGAFSNCTSLKNINIPESVEYIATGSFSNSGLEKIVINGKKCVVEYNADTIPANAVIYGHKGSPAQLYAQMYGRDFVPLSAGECEHTYSEWVIDADATCTQRGFAHRVCTLCNGYEFDVIEKTGHIDNDADNICDVCEDVLVSQSPDSDEEANDESQSNGMTSFFSSIVEMFNKIIAWIKSLFGMA